MVIARQKLWLSGSLYIVLRTAVAQGIFVPVFSCVRLLFKRFIVS